MRDDLIEFFKLMNGFDKLCWNYPPRLMEMDRESKSNESVDSENE
jgi:hypothetical protein